MASPRAETAPTDGRADGRTRRSQRSRRAILEALHELVGAGELRPTAHQVAERAGVGLRTVFRHFSDMETLFAEMNARVREEIAPLRRARPAPGPLDERARELVAQRAALFERIAPFKRSGQLARHRSEFLQEENRRMVRDLREQLREALPELADAPAEVADAIELLTSFEAWERLRGDQRLGARRAREATEAAVLALLERVA